MSDDSRPPPDFAMLRAVEILASIAERAQQPAHALPPPLDVPLILFNEHVMLAIGKTLRSTVVSALGSGYAYPAKGWDTYAMREKNARYLLSVLYRDDVLAGVDYYVPKPNSVPELAPRNFGDFRIVPGPVEIGSEIARLDARFTRVPAGPDAARYAHSFEVRFRGGVAFAQTNADVIQRLVLYAVGE